MDASTAPGEEPQHQRAGVGTIDDADLQAFPGCRWALAPSVRQREYRKEDLPMLGNLASDAGHIFDSVSIGLVFLLNRKHCGRLPECSDGEEGMPDGRTRHTFTSCAHRVGELGGISYLRDRSSGRDARDMTGAACWPIG